MRLTNKLFGVLQLIRPANLFTAVAEILAGVTIAGISLASFHGYNARFNFVHLVLLVLATIGLSGGGAVLNDYFNARSNRLQRPEKPLSTGLLSRNTASLLGYFLILAGILVAFRAGITSGCISLVVAFLIIFYNIYGEHNSFIGPLSMGLSRGANLLLGISFIPHSIGYNFIVILLPVLFIAAITYISRHEMLSGNRLGIQLVGWLYFLVLSYLVVMSFVNGHLLTAIPFIGLLFYLAFKPLTVAFRNPTPEHVANIIRWGTFSLIVLYSALAAAFAGILEGLLILILLPGTIFLSKHFAVS